MALDSSEVRVAVTGAVMVGPTSTTAPTDAEATVVGMTDLGYVAEDGVAETRERSTTKLKAWQNAATIREVVTEATISYKFKLVQTNKKTVELYYGTTVDDATGSLIIDPGAVGGRQAYLIDVIDGDDFIRAWIPSGEVSAVGDQVYASGEPIGYEVTITCYPDSSLTAPSGAKGSVKKFYISLFVGP